MQDDFTHIREIKINDATVQVFDTRIQSGDEYIITNRSISGYEFKASTSIEAIYIYGYLIKAGTVGTQVTALSQVSKEFHDLNFTMVKKLKAFIEQLYSTNEEKERHRLRSVVASTTSFAKKSWSILSPTFSSLSKKLVSQKIEYEMKDITKQADVVGPSDFAEPVSTESAVEIDLSEMKRRQPQKETAFADIPRTAFRRKTSLSAVFDGSPMASIECTESVLSLSVAEQTDVSLSLDEAEKQST